MHRAGLGGLPWGEARHRKGDFAPRRSLVVRSSMESLLGQAYAMNWGWALRIRFVR